MNDMTPWLKLFVVSLIATSCAIGAARAADPPYGPPASEAVQTAEQMVAAGQYNEALQFVAKHLTQGTRDAKSPERYQLLMIRGEALVRSNKASLAGSAFDQAVRAAPDGRSAALARANVLLIKASPSGKYTPKSPGAEAIDIANPESRRDAYGALRDSLSHAFQPKLDKATKSKKLEPAFEALPAVYDLAALELASGGSTEQTQADVKVLGGHARGLIEEQMSRIGHRMSAMEDLANSGADFERRGLYTNEQKDLRKMIDELRRIEQTARDVRRRAHELGFPGTAWEPIAADATDLVEAGEALLEFGSPSTRK